MGNPANFVVVEDGQWQLYYDHLVGCRMLDALAFGPEFAVRYAKRMRACARSEWMGPLGTDGGAVIDVDRNRLLFFGDELMCRMPIRRAMLAVLTMTWPGYEVCWAYGGTRDLASYVGAECKWDNPLRSPDVKLAREYSRGPCHVVSVIHPDGRLRLWPLWWGVSSARHGPALVELLPDRGVRRLSLGQIPVGGVHVDTWRQRVGVWYTDDPEDVFGRLPTLWPGWQTERWDDRYENHVDACDGQIRVPELDLAGGAVAGCDWIRKRVFAPYDGFLTGEVLGSPLRPMPGEWSRFEQECNAMRGIY